MRWFFYNLLFAVAYAAMMPKFLLRMRKRGGYKAHFAERFGRYDPDVARKLAERKRLWIHAVSVGEANLAGLIVKELRRRGGDGVSFVLSTTSSTGRAVMEKLAGPDDVVIYLPLDFPVCVKRAVRAVNASVLVLAESEFWPNLLRALAAKGTPIVLANGRISDKSAPGYRKLRFFFRPVFRLFSAMLVQSPLDRDRLAAAGADPGQITVTGSVKFDVEPPGAEALARVASMLESCGVSAADEKILLGGSTWPGEEIALARAWRELAPDFGDLRLVLVPRHAERAAEVVQALEAEGFRAVRASECAREEGPSGRRKDEIVIVDFTGVLFPAYSFAHVVFVGKTLPPNEGGQNMIEPCSFGKPVVCGPHTENFVPVMAALRRENAVIEIESQERLAPAIRELLESGETRSALGKRAESAVARSRGALAATAGV
ncbi:MAG: 3-deoxy-D-manno-octulosonic acid transferase, partial [Kiritimatiellae bacterium]|nr:3-deoxy-D-manno-octulosonic acid transferase [Kiritimatiellia bacterium]